MRVASTRILGVDIGSGNSKKWTDLRVHLGDKIDNTLDYLDVWKDGMHKVFTWTMLKGLLILLLLLLLDFIYSLDIEIERERK